MNHKMQGIQWRRNRNDGGKNKWKSQITLQDAEKEWMRLSLVICLGTLHNRSIERQYAAQILHHDTQKLVSAPIRPKLRICSGFLKTTEYLRPSTALSGLISAPEI
jgi:hypothetical protein